MENKLLFHREGQPLQTCGDRPVLEGDPPGPLGAEWDVQLGQPTMSRTCQLSMPLSCVGHLVAYLVSLTCSPLCYEQAHAPAPIAPCTLPVGTH